MQAHKVPRALRESVVSMDMGRRDMRTHWLEVDKRTALLILDPVVIASFRYKSNKVWTYEFLPDDYLAFDISQRIVIVQVMPVRSIWDVLGESPLPAKWRPVTKVELRSGGGISEWMEVSRGAITTPAGQIYHNAGFYGFEPEGFTQAETVELIVWRGKDFEVVAVPNALRLQLKEHFLIFDSVSANGTRVSPVAVSDQSSDPR